MNSERVFVLRLWLEPQSDGSGAWRGSVLNPTSGRRRYFTNPEQLSGFLLALDLDWPFEADESSPMDHPEHPRRIE